MQIDGAWARGWWSSARTFSVEVGRGIRVGAVRVRDFFLHPGAAFPGDLRDWRAALDAVRWRRVGPALGGLAVAVIGIALLNVRWGGEPRAHPPRDPEAEIVQALEAERLAFDPRGPRTQASAKQGRSG